jgi:RsiW-degrading membrane proteinase PrsW (M82 family)
VKDIFKKITDEKIYASYFGLNNPEKKDLHIAAFKKAWETRNFEIDKFWQRSMFFWGFIALIFTGYVTVLTGESSQTAKEMYLDFYLILLGIIFSYAWLLVIKGSKRWQENWEQHIDCLEDEITGPLYKTLFYKGEKYYSVSRINQILAWVVIGTWILLLFQYFYTNCSIFKNMLEDICNIFQIIFFLLLPLIGTCICIFCLLRKKGQTSGGKLNKDFKKGGADAFYTKDLPKEQTP